jgi:hypothetical protein
MWLYNSVIRIRHIMEYITLTQELWAI